MCAIEDEHQRLAAIEPHDRMLRESRSIVLVNRSSFLMFIDRRLAAIEPHDRMLREKTIDRSGESVDRGLNQRLFGVIS